MAAAQEQSFETRVEAKLAQLQTGMQMGFGDIQRRLDALERNAKGQPDKCSACRDGLMDRIEGARQEGRELVEGASERIMAEMLAKHRDHEGRVRTLEKGRWKKDGILAVASALLALGGRWLLAKVW